MVSNTLWFGSEKDSLGTFYHYKLKLSKHKYKTDVPGKYFVLKQLTVNKQLTV